MTKGEGLRQICHVRCNLSKTEFFVKHISLIALTLSLIPLAQPAAPWRGLCLPGPGKTESQKLFYFLDYLHQNWHARHLGPWAGPLAISIPVWNWKNTRAKKGMQPLLGCVSLNGWRQLYNGLTPRSVKCLTCTWMTLPTAGILPCLGRHRVTGISWKQHLTAILFHTNHLWWRNQSLQIVLRMGLNPWTIIRQRWLRWQINWIATRSNWFCVLCRGCLVIIRISYYPLMIISYQHTLPVPVYIMHVGILVLQLATLVSRPLPWWPSWVPHWTIWRFK